MLATDNSLFVADLANGSLSQAPFEQGAIYQLESLTHLAIYGDFNGDGVVNFADLLILAQHYGQQNAGYSTGDANNDGTIDFPDLLILAQHYNRDVSSLDQAGVSSVPEPGWTAVMVVGLLLGARRRKRYATASVRSSPAGASF